MNCGFYYHNFSDITIRININSSFIQSLYQLTREKMQTERLHWDLNPQLTRKSFPYSDCLKHLATQS